MEKLNGSAKASEKALDAYLDRIKRLPPAPTLMIQLIKLFRQPDADMEQVVDLLRQDPALAIEVLRRCNSSYCALESPVMDIYEAVFRLGFHEIYQITVAVFGMRMMSVQKDAQHFPVDDLRVHSSITAIAAGALALEAGESEGLAFTTGLLHDVGKLVLAIAENEKYTLMMQDCQRTGSSVSAEEKERFGFNHTEVGARLLHRWGVPLEVMLPVLDHNEPRPEGEWHRFAAITNLASRLANYLQEKSADIPFWQLPGLEPLIKSLALCKEQIQEWEKTVRNKIKQLPALLNG